MASRKDSEGKSHVSGYLKYSLPQLIIGCPLLFVEFHRVNNDSFKTSCHSLELWDMDRSLIPFPTNGNWTLCILATCFQCIWQRILNTKKIFFISRESLVFFNRFFSRLKKKKTTLWPLCLEGAKWTGGKIYSLTYPQKLNWSEFNSLVIDAISARRFRLWIGKVSLPCLAIMALSIFSIVCWHIYAT